MKYVFICMSILMLLVMVRRRRIDFFCIAAVFFVIYNFHCIYGVVFVSSHEHAGAMYYYSEILPQVYLIIIGQMVFLTVYTLINDNKERYVSENDISCAPFLTDVYDEETKYRIFKYLCVIAWAIMLYNVFFKIGLSNISANKSVIWQRIGLLYTASNWMGMAAFSYGIKNKKIVFSILSAAPVLLHFFIGSRAYMVVLILIIVINYSHSIGQSIIKHWKIVVSGSLAGIFVLAYKKMYELIKVGDFAGAFSVLLDPETYAFISRLGEPRIILANLNYIIGNSIHLGFGDIWERMLYVIPFANNIFGSNYTAVSTILRESMSSSYGLGSNIWGEYYAMGSYFLIIVMFFVWLKMLSWGNNCLKRSDYSSYFIIPPLLYTAFYVHRQDFVKMAGYYKAALFALAVYMIIGMIISKQGAKIYYRAKESK